MTKFEEELRKKYQPSKIYEATGKLYYLNLDDERLQVSWQEDLYYINSLGVLNNYFTSSFGDRIYFSGFKHLECLVPEIGFDLLYKNIHKERFYRIKDKSLINYIDWNPDKWITVWSEWGSIKFIKINQVENAPEPKEEDLVEIDFDNHFYNNHFWLDRKGTRYNNTYIKGTNE